MPFHPHLPKPLHGWREFVGEVGIIMIGVLLALGAEQVVEAVHHRSQVSEMTDKLRAESIDNRHVLDYDLIQLQQTLALTDANIAALNACRGTGVARNLRSFAAPSVFLPGDATWLGIRDSALLPLMPELLVDNYWKIDSMIGGYASRMLELRQDAERAAGAVEALRDGAVAPQVCNEALLRLNEMKQNALSLTQLTTLIRASNEQALRGERIDAAGAFLKRLGRS